MFDNITKTEESRIAIIIMLTWLIFMPLIAIQLYSELAVWFLVLEGLVLLCMLIIYLMGRKSSALKGLKRDERTEKFSLKASRNGFLMAVALTTVLGVLAWLRGSYIGNWDLLVWIWMWSTGTYGLSYLYYVMRG